jgi:hypothetical protein
VQEKILDPGLVKWLVMELSVPSVQKPSPDTESTKTSLGPGLGPGLGNAIVTETETGTAGDGTGAIIAGTRTGPSPEAKPSPAQLLLQVSVLLSMLHNARIVTRQLSSSNQGGADLAVVEALPTLLRRRRMSL